MNHFQLKTKCTSKFQLPLLSLIKSFALVTLLNIVKKIFVAFLSLIFVILDKKFCLGRATEYREKDFRGFSQSQLSLIKSFASAALLNNVKDIFVVFPNLSYP
jgi:hypothetical protein